MDMNNEISNVSWWSFQIKAGYMKDSMIYLPHNPECSLRRRARETGNHLFFECRFTRHIWTELANWLAAPPLLPANWEPAESLHTWWTALARTTGVSRKGIKSLIILICWEIWKERNAQIFDRLRGTFFHGHSKDQRWNFDLESCWSKATG